jgi:hypothetical protein
MQSFQIHRLQSYPFSFQLKNFSQVKVSGEKKYCSLGHANPLLPIKQPLSSLKKACKDFAKKILPGGTEGGDFFCKTL